MEETDKKQCVLDSFTNKIQWIDIIFELKYFTVYKQPMLTTLTITGSNPTVQMQSCPHFVFIDMLIALN